MTIKKTTTADKILSKSTALDLAINHLSNIDHREGFRKISVIEDVCKKQIKGKGKKGYLEAINLFIKS